MLLWRLIQSGNCTILGKMTTYNHPRHPNQLTRRINPINSSPATRSRSALSALRFTPATLTTQLATRNSQVSVHLFPIRNQKSQIPGPDLFYKDCLSRLQLPQTFQFGAIKSMPSRQGRPKSKDPQLSDAIQSIRNPKSKIPNQRTRTP